MELQRTLEGHGGCVNTVSFNPAGDLLVSGSDDQSVMLWDWRRGGYLWKNTVVDTQASEFDNRLRVAYALRCCDL
jgi:WD40 repeat protein